MAKAKKTTKVKSAKKTVAKTKKAAMKRAAPKKVAAKTKKAAPKAVAAKKAAVKAVTAKKAAVKNVMAKAAVRPVKSAQTVVRKSNTLTALPKMTTSQEASATYTLVGQEIADDVTAPATGGKTVNLKDHAGQKVVLFFYPKDMTPGCTIEGHEFTKLKDQFAKKNTVIYGVSRDSVALHEKFKEKECYTIDLLSDADEKICNTFGVIKDKNMYGKTVRGIERSTFVIDEAGRVVKEWRGVKAEGHAQEVLEYLTTQSV